ncbi:unnamed protein product, partial [Phaeothamnion confervicola]
ALLDCFPPLERVVLTANGNLQRVVSSYYNSAVTVSIVRCAETEAGSGVYDREVTLSVGDRPFCTARSLVVLHSDACRAAVDTGAAGIGQLFRHLDTLPSFALLNAGRRCGGGFWRLYDLRSRHLSCRIYEEFPRDLFELPRDG